jgi:DNA-binding CsgD family transcriptional regulator
MSRKKTFRYTSRDGLLVLDVNGCVVFANDVARTLLELTDHELRNKLCFELFEGRDLQGNRFCFKNCSPITMAKKHQPGQNIDLEVTTRSGTKRWFNVSTLLEDKPRCRGTTSLIIHLFRPVPCPISREEHAAETGGPETTGPSDPIATLLTRFPLSPRQAEILVLLIQGLVAKEIGVRLNISTATVRTHVQHVLKKLRVHSKLEAVALVFRQPRK